MDAGEERPKHPPIYPLTSRTGRTISWAALIERIVQQFNEEFDMEAPETQNAPEHERRQALLEVADYILAVELIDLNLDEKVSVLREAFSELFGFGALDALLEDPSITTISLEGVEKISVRRAPNEELMPIDPIFDSREAVKRSLGRLAIKAGAQLSEQIPILEAGLLVRERPINFSIAVPPYTHDYSADIRLHPAQALTLSDLEASGYVNGLCVEWLTRLAQSAHGFCIVGEPVSGKTSLMGALLPLMPDVASLVAVERAASYRLPAGATRHVVVWPLGEQAGATFGEQVAQAAAMRPGTMLLDEVRTDEADAVAPLLADEAMMRQLWVVRGSSDSKRIRSALAILGRMAYRQAPEAGAARVLDRLPFVLVARRRRNQMLLHELGEWQQHGDGLRYVSLLAHEDGDWLATGQAPQRAL